MQKQEEQLTKENARQATRFLQALDIEAEKTYNLKHDKAVSEKMKLSESDVSELVEEFNNQVPGHILLMNGNGYRILITLLANVLIAIEKEELAQVVLKSREPEI